MIYQAGAKFTARVPQFTNVPKQVTGKNGWPVLPNAKFFAVARDVLFTLKMVSLVLAIGF
jgi:hypothetical protein